MHLRRRRSEPFCPQTHLACRMSLFSAALLGAVSCLHTTSTGLRLCCTFHRASSNPVSAEFHDNRGRWALLTARSHSEYGKPRWIAGLTHAESCSNFRSKNCVRAYSVSLYMRPNKTRLRDHRVFCVPCPARSSSWIADELLPLVCNRGNLPSPWGRVLRRPQ